jgi:hypothetical protein
VEKRPRQVATIQQQLTFQEFAVSAHVPPQFASRRLDSQKENRLNTRRIGKNAEKTLRVFEAI